MDGSLATSVGAGGARDTEVWLHAKLGEEWSGGRVASLLTTQVLNSLIEKVDSESTEGNTGVADGSQAARERLAMLDAAVRIRLFCSAFSLRRANIQSILPSMLEVMERAAHSSERLDHSVAASNGAMRPTASAADDDEWVSRASAIIRSLLMHAHRDVAAACSARTPLEHCDNLCPELHEISQGVLQEAAVRLKGGDGNPDAESVRSDMFGTLSMATPFLSAAIVSDFAPSAVQPDRDHPPASARSHSHFVPSSYPERPMRDAAPSTAGNSVSASASSTELRTQGMQAEGRGFGGGVGMMRRSDDVSVPAFARSGAPTHDVSQARPAALGSSGQFRLGASKEKAKKRMRVIELDEVRDLTIMREGERRKRRRVDSHAEQERLRKKQEKQEELRRRREEREERARKKQEEQEERRRLIEERRALKEATRQVRKAAAKDDTKKKRISFKRGAAKKDAGPDGAGGGAEGSAADNAPDSMSAEALLLSKVLGGAPDAASRPDSKAEASDAISATAADSKGATEGDRTSAPTDMDSTPTAPAPGLSASSTLPASPAPSQSAQALPDMFDNAVLLSARERHIIKEFLGGRLAVPPEGTGLVHQFLLQEEKVRSEKPPFRELLQQSVFEIDFGTKSWRKFKRRKPVPIPRAR